MLRKSHQTVTMLAVDVSARVDYEPMLTLVTKLPYFTGLPRDVSVASFHFEARAGEIDVEAAATYWGPKVEDFFNANFTSGIGDSYVGGWLSNVIDRSNATITGYEHDAAHSLGDPLFENTWTLSPEFSDNSMPLEVALCTSMLSVTQGLNPGHGRSERGRLYIGPLNQDVIAPTSGALPFPAPHFITGLTASTTALAAYNLDSADEEGEWVIWSRKLHTTSAIVAGFVNNDFDTQRRRGVRATARTTWDIRP